MVLVTRNGLPAATIHPVDVAPLRPPFVPSADPARDDHDVDLGNLALTGLGKRVADSLQRTSL